MGIGTKLTIAFIVVILVMVLGNAGYSLYNDYKFSREGAVMRLASGIKKLDQEFKSLTDANMGIAGTVCQDQPAMTALAHRDREGMGQALKSVISKTSLVGFITIVDSQGNVFYSTDAPAKYDYSAREKSNGVQTVFKMNDVYRGPACFSQTGSLTLSSMMPIRVSGRVDGVVIVSQPLNNEFLTGLVTKFALDNDHLTGIDMALLSYKDNKLVALTPNLMSPTTAGKFVQELQQRGIAAMDRPPAETAVQKLLHLPGFESGGRWWLRYDLVESEQGKAEKASDMVAGLLLTTSVPDLTARLQSVVLLASTCGAVGLCFALLFVSGISKGVNEPLRFLIDRTSELASQRSQIPPLEGLSGQWLELGELIDTALHTMRASTQNLKQQLNKQVAEIEDKSKAADEAQVQLDALNRQFSNQAKQLSEVSKQINYANRQSVLLQHKLDSVLQVSTEGFLLLDQYGNVLSANPVFLSWIGATEGEIAGRLCFDLVKRPGESGANDQDGRAFTRHSGNPNDLINQFYPEGVIYHRREQKSVSVLAHLQPVTSEDAGIQGYVMVLRDKSLRSENTQLRNEIVTMLAENIRAPLAMAEGTWQAILSTVAQTMPPTIGQPLADLHARYEHLLAVVDSLLMTYGGFVPQPVAPRDQIVVGRLVSESLEQVSGLARDRQLALDYKSVTGLPNIGGNREALKAVLIPVLEKLIGVTAPGGRVRVESIARGAEMRVGVSSSGPSVPDGEIADMFIGFIEGKHHQSSYSSRLSMYLARNNIERMGGKIWAESEAGRGTVIFFTLPVS